MLLDLDSIATSARRLGFPTNRIDQETLEIALGDDLFLVFKNFEERNHNVFGFRGTPGHDHDSIYLMIGDDEYVNFEAIDIIAAIRDGSILIIEEYVDGVLLDRWMQHRDAKVDNQDMMPGEKVRIRRFPFLAEQGKPS